MADIKSFSECSDEELEQYLKMHYAKKIDLTQYWHVGDTRVMHLNAMPSNSPYGSESHVAQDMTMVIIGMNHDTLVTPINGNDKAIITLQCREILGSKGKMELSYIWGSGTHTTSDSNYSKNPRRTWLNGTFINSLPSTIQPLVKTVIKKNINDHSSSPGSGPDTEDKAFLTSYTEMFGNVAYSYYMNNKKPNNEEGEQYAYYSSNARRTKYPNNNGTAGSLAYYYWLRSPSSDGAYYWIIVETGGSADSYGSYSNYGLAPAFCLAAEPDPEPVIHHKLLKNGKVIQGIYKNGKKLLGIAHNGELIWKYEQKPKYPTPEEAPFATATDEQISQVLEAYYNGLIDINDYWKVGDTRVMHLSAMPSGTGANESHAEQDMTMIIIGIEHDNLKEPINGKTKAAITLNCKEVLANKGKYEGGNIWGSNPSTNTKDTDNWSNNPRRTWCNTTFISALPNDIQPLVKTVIKKNLANHTNNTAGPNTEDKAFLTSYPEEFGDVPDLYGYYKGSQKLEGEQYEYYNSDARRIKYPNNNGVASKNKAYYFLRSPSWGYVDRWVQVNINGQGDYNGGGPEGPFAPAFCL